MRTEAHFVASANGVVEPATHPSQGGTYTGVSHRAVVVYRLSGVARRPGSAGTLDRFGHCIGAGAGDIRFAGPKKGGTVGTESYRAYGRDQKPEIIQEVLI